MTIGKIRVMKKYIILYTMLITILFMLIQNARAQLEVFEKNSNYLSYNGSPIFLITSTPNGQDFHIMDFDLNHITRMKAYGANHVWVMLENYYNTPWSQVKDTPAAYWDKLEAIAKKCYENDVILGVSIFGYGLIRYPFVYSFNKACDCKGGPGPLTDPLDFYDITKTTAEAVEAREVQMKMMREIVAHTWKYQNVYYSPGWEIKVIWSTKVAEWFRWMTSYMEDQGHLLDPNKDHLFAIEKTVDPQEAFNLNADFVIDEDANAYKREGIPFVYWSMDGVYRGTSVWNDKDTEPTRNWDFTREEVISGAAGIATIWGVDPEEEDYLLCISNFVKNVETWCDEPGQEITSSTVPATPEDTGINLPANGNCADYTDYSTFEITNISATTGSPYIAEHVVNVGTKYYTDRDYTINFLPHAYRGLIWLKTANTDKKSVLDPFLSYNINQDATVYVGYDSRLSVKPAWLSGWTATGDVITDDTGVVFDLLKKEYSRGTVTLGPNNGSVGSMYIILHKPSNDLDLVAPSIPSNVMLRPLFN